jgi:hypothetical protein
MRRLISLAINYLYVTRGVTHYREKPGIENRALGTVQGGQTITATNPIRHTDNRMWVMTKINFKDVWMCADVMTAVQTGAVTTAPPPNLTKKEPDKSVLANTAAYERSLAATTNISQNSLMQLAMSGRAIPVFRSIHALPFQFTTITDRRIGNEAEASRSYGRGYAQEILLKTPVVTFTPGYPAFLSTDISTLSKSKKDEVLAALQNEGDVALTGLSAGKYKKINYYQHRTNMTRYWGLVNSMMRLHCNLANITDTIDGVKLTNYNWQLFNKSDGKKISSISTTTIKQAIQGEDEGVSFAIEPNGSISTNMGNSTKESSLSGMYKGLSDKAREASFILGMGAGKEIDFVGTDENIEELTASMSDMSKYNPMSPFSRLMEHGSTLRTGAHIRFPEIWSDSNFGTDYQVTVKLESPYADPVSKAIHVALPFYMLLALGGAQTYGVDGYGSPFIIKAESKGLVSSELCMIDSIQWRKNGDGEQLSHDLVPMAMEVTVSFKDLYQVLSLAESKDLSSFWNNDTLLDLVENTAGINMNRLSGLDRVSLYTKTFGKDLSTIPGSFKEQLIDNFRLREFGRTFGLNKYLQDTWSDNR